jgi:hypothetical protein
MLENPALSATGQEPHSRNHFHSKAGEILIALALNDTRAYAVKESFLAPRVLASGPPQFYRDGMSQKVLEWNGSMIVHDEVQLEIKESANSFVGRKSDQGQDIGAQWGSHSNGPICLGHRRHIVFPSFFLDRAGNLCLSFTGQAIAFRLNPECSPRLMIYPFYGKKSAKGI